MRRFPAALLFTLTVAVPVVASISLAAVAPAQAQSSAKAAVDAAKAAGVVGEQADGYLGVVSGGDATVRAAVAEINAGRAGAYRAAGESAGTTTTAAGEAASRQLLARMPQGYFYRSVSGAWEKK